MTIKAFRHKFNESLASVYPTVEIDSLFFQLMEHVQNIDRAEIILNINSELDLDVQNKVIQFMYRLEKKEPIQYIIGQTIFAGIPINLNRHVLIPRPETESLVYWIKSREPDDLAILDICSGSGCIAFALENHINARVTAWDISNEALTIAKQTAVSIGSNVSFSQVDILKQFQIQDRWDIIVSNPPYIKTRVIRNLESDVSEFEPFNALDGGNDGLDVIKKVIYKSREILKIKGLLALEIGNEQNKEVSKILKKNSFRIKYTVKDYKDNVRCLISSREN